MISGTLTTGTAATDTVSYSFNSGAFKVNTTAGQKGITANSTTEGGSDPYIGVASLTLSEQSGSAVPAPAVVPAMAALGGLGLIGGLRRRNKLA